MVDLYVCDEYCDRLRGDGSWNLYRGAASDALEEEAHIDGYFWTTYLVSGPILSRYLHLSLMDSPSVIAASACQAFYANQVVESPDPTFDTSLFTISTQVAQCLGLITCCSPQMKPFIESLRSFGFYVDGRPRHGSSGVRHDELLARPQKQEDLFHQQHELGTISPFNSSYQTAVTASPSKREWDAGSQSSQAHIIHEIRTWTVTESVKNTSPVVL
ncbi:unnamed protein product [Aspergillus oryzae var. brunneus]|uniref:Unnamed protein product n=2 Tax=Aspergillus oryzae TaxID=5062 RepID=A0AAN5BW81_ASPOZ|nr:unnamed protein product [Aspergillus oryzae]GMG49883.1 unnamed protein product [Aspergillus oryzae var. brunneus]